MGRFDQNITNGRGFIALAAVIFGRWHPVGALTAALVFGLAEAIQLKMSNLDTGIPSEFLLMAPYIVTLIVVAGFVGRSRAPKAAGQAYDASESLLFGFWPKRFNAIAHVDVGATNDVNAIGDCGQHGIKTLRN